MFLRFILAAMVIVVADIEFVENYNNFDIRHCGYNTIRNTDIRVRPCSSGLYCVEDSYEIEFYPDRNETRSRFLCVDGSKIDGCVNEGCVKYGEEAELGPNKGCVCTQLVTRTEHEPEISEECACVH